MFKSILFAGCILVINTTVKIKPLDSIPEKANTDTFQFQNGDILFQDLDCGPLCKAIKEVTHGYKGAKFAHVGLLVKKRSGMFIIEAISRGVSLTPLSEFLARNTDRNSRPLVAVGRLKPKYRHLIPLAIKDAMKYRGRPYDSYFNIHNDSLYCSELIYLAFRLANHNHPLFSLYPMTYKSPSTGRTFPAWAAYFKKLGAPVPEGAPGCNPGGISRSPLLHIFFPFAQPQRFK